MRKKNSLVSIVEKMNEAYDGKVGDSFNLGVDRRVVPLFDSNGVCAWKVQKMIGDVWVDECHEVFNTMEELISRLKTETEEENEKFEEL
ncbi:MAG: hypothetical protein J6X18_06825 [Bacteroidales bacterium]|nr:hypothetical protein [Bacteroidales bacterium]